MDWMKYRIVYLIISGSVILLGLFSIFMWGFPLALDFKGGSIIEYKIEEKISTEDIIKSVEKESISVSSVQVSEGANYILKLQSLSEDEKNKIGKVVGDLTNGKAQELRFEMVGPSVGPELVKKTIVALFISATAILFWIAFQFKSLKFGISAVLAMLHDSLVVLGLYSLFGHFWKAEVDFLFVTAVLTILSFSVHDTIVVYDRIRESQKKTGGSIYDLANKALSETMVRSLNNSFTIVFMLLALILLGGTTIKWFAVTLLVGTVSGTYSSPFVAVPILVTWNEIQTRMKSRSGVK